MLEKYAVEISLLWDNDIGQIFSEFVKTYKELLNKLYKQRVCISLIDNYNKGEIYSTGIKQNSTVTDKQMLDNAKRMKLFETINEIDRIYNRIINENLEQKLIDDLKL